jgi:hypothetical protein
MNHTPEQYAEISQKSLNLSLIRDNKIIGYYDLLVQSPKVDFIYNLYPDLALKIKQKSKNYHENQVKWKELEDVFFFLNKVTLELLKYESCMCDQKIIKEYGLWQIRINFVMYSEMFYQYIWRIITLYKEIACGQETVSTTKFYNTIIANELNSNEVAWFSIALLMRQFLIHPEDPAFNKNRCYDSISTLDSSYLLYYQRGEKTFDYREYLDNFKKSVKKQGKSKRFKFPDELDLIDLYGLQESVYPLDKIKTKSPFILLSPNIFEVYRILIKVIKF